MVFMVVVEGPLISGQPRFETIRFSASHIAVEPFRKGEASTFSAGYTMISDSSTGTHSPCSDHASRYRGRPNDTENGADPKFQY